jgi:hypothetical protein
MYHVMAMTEWLCPASDRQINQQLYDLAPFGDKKV